MGEPGYSESDSSSALIDTRRIDRAKLPGGVAELAESAAAEGYGMLGVLVRDWADGTNRFDRPGEGLFAAWLQDRLVGVAGLNIDPFADTWEKAGRVRRLYVLPDARGRGVGRTLIDTIAAAAGSFDKLTAFTPDAAGGAFYEACGFSRVDGFARRSHERSL